jgi:hypothetical protein
MLSSGGKFAFPGQFAFAFGYIGFAFMPAASNMFASDL